MTDAAIDKAAIAVERYGMLGRGMKVLVAVSGGPDSVALLSVLTSLTPRYALKLGVCHLNHNLRAAESDGDERFVKRLARRLGLRFFSRKLEKGELDGLGEGMQDAARRIRYAYFEEVARCFKADRVALGHTLDDRAETVLMRFIKGASLSGLAGIPPVRGIYIRPLFDVSRVEVEAHLKSAKAAWRVDSSNLKDDYLRNDVRLRLLPLLKRGYNPNIAETLARTADALRADEEFISREAERVYRAALLSEREGAVEFDLKALRQLAPALLTRVFLGAARRVGAGARFSSVHADVFLSAVSSARPNASYDLPGGVRINREYGRLVVSSAASTRPPEPRPYSYAFSPPGKLFIAEAGCVVSASILKKAPASLRSSPDTAYFDMDGLLKAGPLDVRSPGPGDRFTPFGMKGTRKLKELFIDKKVAPALRRVTPVVVAGGEVVWVAGVARSDLFKVGKSTGKVLKLTVAAAD